MNQTLPLWVDLTAAVLVVFGAFMALVGSFGVARLKSFFQRVHAPTLGATVGIWSVTGAGALQFSFLHEQLFVHALLLGIFVLLTTPVTTVFLMRAALFRTRLSKAPGVPATVPTSHRT